MGRTSAVQGGGGSGAAGDSDDGVSDGVRGWKWGSGGGVILGFSELGV